MTEVEHAGGLVTSSKVPALHLIPTEALLCLADRFEVGTKRKGDGAWNALTKNQECLNDNAFLIERCSHIIRHTMMLRDQLAHGYSNEDEDTPYENAGAIIFGGALMACAMARRGACVCCGLCFTEAGQVACRDCMAYAYKATGCPMEAAPVESPDDWVELPPEHVLREGVDEFSIGQGARLTWHTVDGLHGSKVSDWPHDKARCRRKDLPAPQPVESPDDWVVQDRVPARETDRGAWLDNGEEYPPYDFQTRHWWTVRGTNAVGYEAGSVDAVGRTLHLICRRKDLPGVAYGSTERIDGWATCRRRDLPEVVDPNNPPMPASPEPEDGYVVQDKADPRVGTDEFRWVGDGYSQPWKPVESSHVLGGRHGFFDESDGTTLEVRCLKKDLPESEDGYVVQDRVPRRPGVDEYRWVYSDGSIGGWTTVESHNDMGGRHGFFDESDGTTLEVRCLKKDLPEPEDEYVVQDRVPRRPGVDESRWVAFGGPPDSWRRTFTGSPPLTHGYVDVFGDRLEVRCLKKDLPEPEDVYVVQDRVPRRPGVDEYRWVYSDGSIRGWSMTQRNSFPVEHGYIDPSGSELEVRCLKKDLPEIETPPEQSSLHPPSAGASFRCRNHGVISGLEFNPTQSLWFWPNRSDVCWDLYGKAVGISQDWTDNELRGFDIVAKIDLPKEAKCQDGTA